MAPLRACRSIEKCVRLDGSEDMGAQSIGYLRFPHRSSQVHIPLSSSYQSITSFLPLFILLLLLLSICPILPPHGPNPLIFKLVLLNPFPYKAKSFFDEPPRCQMSSVAAILHSSKPNTRNPYSIIIPKAATAYPLPRTFVSSIIPASPASSISFSFSLPFPCPFLWTGLSKPIHPSPPTLTTSPSTSTTTFRPLSGVKIMPHSSISMEMAAGLSRSRTERSCRVSRSSEKGRRRLGASAGTRGWMGDSSFTAGWSGDGW